MVDVLCWFFVFLARRLPACILQQDILRQVLPGSGNGEARTMLRIRLAAMLVIIARWVGCIMFLLLFLSNDVDNY
jgi:sigma54-dependent transcription regulator